MKAKPKFKEGDSVLRVTDNRPVTIKGEPKWNGFTYMYSFIECDMRCGEYYLILIPKKR